MKSEDTEAPNGIHCELKPRLRFPDFESAAAWTVKSMGDVYTFLRTNSLSRDKLNYELGSVRNIHYGDIHTKFRTHFRIQQERVPYVTPSALPQIDPDSYCVEGDMVFADASEDLQDVGKSIEVVSLNGERVLSGQHTILARPTVGSLVNYFGGYLFQSTAIRAQIKKEAQGAKVLGISPRKLSKINLYYPSDTTEQQKIVECLSSIDELIAAEERKLSALKAHKKGLLQQVFRADGETIPRLRFPDFQALAQWERKYLKDISDVRGGKRLPVGATLTTENTGYPYIRVTDMRRGSIDVASVQYISADVERQIRQYKISADDLFITVAGTIGVVGQVPRELDQANLTENANKIIVKAADENFLLQYLLSEGAQNEVASAITNNAQPKLALERIRKLHIPLPQRKEQQAVAELLSTFDRILAATGLQIATLKAHKKGLMQQLFPVLDEVQEQTATP